MKKTINQEYAFMEDFVNELPSGRFAYSGIILHYKKNCVKMFDEQGRRIVVKRHSKPHLLKRILYSFSGSRAERAYRNAHKLLSMGVKTPGPVGFINVYSKGLLSGSYYVSEYSDYRPVTDIQDPRNKENEALFNALVSFTVSLHDKGIRHDDYNLSNVLYKKTKEGRYDFMLIDIHSISYGPMSPRMCLSNIKRLCPNPDLAYRFATAYAVQRGWDQYRSIAMLAMSRSLFERKNERRRQLREWAEEIV